MRTLLTFRRLLRDIFLASFLSATVAEICNGNDWPWRISALISVGYYYVLRFSLIIHNGPRFFSAQIPLISFSLSLHRIASGTVIRGPISALESYPTVSREMLFLPTNSKNPPGILLLSNTPKNHFFSKKDYWRHVRDTHTHQVGVWTPFRLTHIV